MILKCHFRVMCWIPFTFPATGWYNYDRAQFPVPVKPYFMYRHTICHGTDMSHVHVSECSHAMQLTGHISCTRMFTCHATHRSHLMYLNTLMPGSDMQLINLLSVTKISPTGLLPGTLPSPDRSHVMKIIMKSGVNA